MSYQTRGYMLYVWSFLSSIDIFTSNMQCAAMLKFPSLLRVVKTEFHGPISLLLSRLYYILKIASPSCNVDCRYLGHSHWSDVIYSLNDELMQQVAVLHLEERCERAIAWALKIEPSLKHLVTDTDFLLRFCFLRDSGHSFSLSIFFFLCMPTLDACLHVLSSSGCLWRSRVK